MELLNGENNINNKKEVEKTIMNIIDMSDKDKKKKLKNILKISGIVICLIVIVSGIIFTINRIKINKLQKEIEAYKQIADNSTPYRYALKEIGDGWVCSMSVEYKKDDLKVPSFYGYDCYNMKYKYLEGFNYLPNNIKRDSTSFYNYEIISDFPSYRDKKEYFDELMLINEFFAKKKFANKIEEKDLDELKLNKIKKADVLDIFNSAISSDLITEYGNYNNIATAYVNESSVLKSNSWFGKERDYKFVLGYMTYCGHIYYVNIDLMIDNEYLSDIVNNGKATDDQKALYDEMKSIQNAIIYKQSFREAFKTYVHPALEHLQENLHLIETDQKDEIRGSVYDYAW